MMPMWAFNAYAAMSEEQCKSQATAVPHLLEIVESGTMPATKSELAELKKAQEYLEKGEYCAARAIVLAIGQNS
ncbi:hypothetical protein KW507_15715 [Vibrio fluvialis]|nr:hypothetical protein [Vibrio fluvialis]